MDLLAGLNKPQIEAVTHRDGPLLILAGAGSGKTRVITHRIAYLVKEYRVPAWAILAVTFTNKAAGEMRDRVQSLLGGGPPKDLPALSTFHSFCVRLLRRDGDRLAPWRSGFNSRFLIYDEDDQLSVVKGVYRALGLDDKFMPPRSALSRISHLKSTKQTPQDVYNDATDPRNARFAVLYERYDERLKQANALDFDDLLLETVRLLEFDEELRAAWNRRIGYLMVDEYQDTNRSQYELMRLLSGGNHNVAVVGDEDQSIYGWRGADINNILDFEKDFPNARVIRLEQNYRSTKTILEAASAMVANNKERKGKWLWTEAGQGERIGMFEAYDGEQEALFIADTIERLLAKSPRDRAAVLYRTNSQSRQIEEALRRYQRKYLVVGGLSFYQRAEVKDLLAYLKVLLNPQDSVSLLRIINTPARGIGKTTLEQLEGCALENNLSVWTAMERMIAEHQLPARAEAALVAFRRMMEGLVAQLSSLPFPEVMNEILEHTGYRRMLEAEQTPENEARLGNLGELLNAAAEAMERGEGPSEFLDHAALVADSDDLDERAQVSLLTAHNAKGLEFDIVFVAGLEERLLPHSRSLLNESQMEEERRLFYVAMTRAQKQLFITWARSRRRFGGGPNEPSLPSRFLREIPRQLTERLSDGPAIPQIDLYAERHEVRETVRKNTYTGKTYNSLENIAQFFEERGVKPPVAPQAQPSAEPVNRVAPLKAAPPAPPKKKRLGTGATIEHPRFGRGIVLRREGDGDDAKLTISFPAYGLKKIFEKYAGIRVDE